MNRLIITGFACCESSWEKSFSSLQLDIIPLNSLISKFGPDLKAIIKGVKKILVKENYDTLILHDFGVTIGLAALTSLQKISSFKSPKIILFNGVFRGFNVFRSLHPVKVNIFPLSFVRNSIYESNGSMSEWYVSNYLSIRKIYRQVIFISCRELFLDIFTKELGRPLKIDLKTKIKFFYSKNDPFLTSVSIDQLLFDFENIQKVEIEYGHYPYSIEFDWSKEIEVFENE